MATTVLKMRISSNLGSISAASGASSYVIFGIGDILPTGNLNIVCSGGAVSTPTWVLESSLDGGTSWFTVSATAYTTSGLVTGDTSSLYAAKYSVTGLEGALFKFALTAGTGISATTVYGLIG